MNKAAKTYNKAVDKDNYEKYHPASSSSDEEFEVKSKDGSWVPLPKEPKYVFNPEGIHPAFKYNPAGKRDLETDEASSGDDLQSPPPLKRKKSMYIPVGSGQGGDEGGSKDSGVVGLVDDIGGGSHGSQDLLEGGGETGEGKSG